MTDRHPCFDTADRVLVKKETKLTFAMVMIPEGTLRLCIATEKLEPRQRKKPVIIVANYCPFCGVKLDA